VATKNDSTIFLTSLFHRVLPPLTNLHIFLRTRHVGSFEHEVVSVVRTTCLLGKLFQFLSVDNDSTNDSTIERSQFSVICLINAFLLF